MNGVNRSNGVNESNGVNVSDGVNKSNGVNKSDAVNWSDGVNESYGVNWSNGVNRSNGVKGSDGVDWSNGVKGSDGVNKSNGVNWSNGVNGSNGVNWSNGVNGSNGVNESYGIINSFGVDKALFLADKKRSFSVFGIEVLKERFNEIWDELHNKLNGWKPEFNNAFKLWVGAGKDWKLVKADKICSTLEKWDDPYKAWKTMPKEAIEYVKSLPEFNADMFKRITGIDVNDKCCHKDIKANFCPQCGYKLK